MFTAGLSKENRKHKDKIKQLEDELRLLRPKKGRLFILSMWMLWPLLPHQKAREQHYAPNADVRTNPNRLVTCYCIKQQCSSTFQLFLSDETIANKTYYAII